MSFVQTAEVKNQTGHSIKVRAAHIEDVDYLLESISKLSSGASKLNKEDIIKEIRSSERHLKDEASFVNFLVAEDIGSRQYVGYLMYCYYYTPWSGHSASIAGLIIQPEYRGRGELYIDPIPI